jgi:hypothetical protein
MTKYLNRINMQHIFISFFSLIAVFYLLVSCSSKSENRRESENYNSSYSAVEEDENNEITSGCKFEDGTYSATVDYNNPETGYSATYTLDVDVQDCQVIQINFPNDGYLDKDHISYSDIDEDGNASVEGEDGKTYEINIAE